MPLPEDASLLTRRQAVARLASGAVLSGSRASWAQAPDPLLSASADDWHYATLAGMAKRIEAKAISPVELTRRMLDRIAALDGGLHGYVTVMNEQAMASARTAEAEIQAGRYRGPPHGMPIGVKDLCFTKGVPTLAGTLVLRDFVPAFDSTVVARLNAAGAVVLGKLTLCEGAMGPYHPDLQVPANPWDATRWSGVFEYGRKVTGVGYAAATRIRAEVVGQVNRMLFDVDCMACPSLSNAAPPKMADPFREETDATWAALVLNDVHTKPFNFSGSPTLSVPCGFSTDGLPFSVQFVGRALSEATLCRVGHTYEMTSPWHGKHPPV